MSELVPIVVALLCMVLGGVIGLTIGDAINTIRREWMAGGGE